MSAKKRSSDRVRSRPVQKQSPVKKIKRNKFAMFLVILIVAMLVFSGFYVIFTSLTSEDDNDVATGNPIAVFDTTMGEFKVELYEDKVPITAGNFIDLAKDGFYDGLIFHRVISNFMIQGGDPYGDGTGGHAAEYHEGYGSADNAETWKIPDEFHEDLSNVRGTISMANSGPNTGGSQFFINVDDNIHLDYNKYLDQVTFQIVYEEVPYPQDGSKHAVFGKVIDGMDVVDEISKVSTGSNDNPIIDVVINSISIVD